MFWGQCHLHPRWRGLSSLVQVTVMGRLGSDFTLQSKRAVEPLMADWCSGARTIRVGSDLERGYRDMRTYRVEKVAHLEASRV